MCIRIVPVYKGKTMVKRFLFLCTVVLFCTSCPSVKNANNLTPDEAEELAWATRVCVSAEYGFPRNRVVKWARPVRVSVIQGQANSDVIDVIDTLNDQLKGSPVSVELVPYPDKSADIELYMTELNNFTSIARENKFNYVKGNWGYVYCFWNKEYEINKAYVLIATDVLEGVRLRHFIFEEMVQGFGLLNDSRTYTDSIFFSGNQYDLLIDSLSERDKKLVRFLYSKLNAGDTKQQFEQAFIESWKDIAVE